MLAHEDLSTIEVHSDWDFPLINQLKDVAILYEDWGWFEGDWEKLEEVAIEILRHFDNDAEITQELRRLFNNVLVERQKHDFALGAGDDSGGDELWTAQQALVDELLEYYADPEMYVIVHALDEAHGDEAWFLCYLEDVENLGLGNTLQA